MLLQHFGTLEQRWTKIDDYDIVGMLDHTIYTSLAVRFRKNAVEDGAYAFVEEYFLEPAVEWPTR